MKFNFSEEHLMIQKSARDFAQQELLPGVIERDELQKFPKDEINKMGQMGFLGMVAWTLFLTFLLWKKFQK